MDIYGDFSYMEILLTIYGDSCTAAALQPHPLGAPCSPTPVQLHPRGRQTQLHGSRTSCRATPPPIPTPGGGGPPHCNPTPWGSRAAQPLCSYTPWRRCVAQPLCSYNLQPHPATGGGVSCSYFINKRNYLIFVFFLNNNNTNNFTG